jgi:hypothetical protein
LHVLSEAEAVPLVVGVSAANTDDILALKPLVRGVPAIRSRRGSRRRGPGKFRADKGHHSADSRAWLRQRGIAALIACPGMEPSARLGWHRWKIERSIAWLFGYRRRTVRYERKGSRRSGAARTPAVGTGVWMYDGSALEYAENVATTAAVVEWCHERGVPVEAELGVLGGKDGVHAPGARTDPGQAVEFVDAIRCRCAHRRRHGILALRDDVAQVLTERGTQHCQRRRRESRLHHPLLVGELQRHDIGRGCGHGTRTPTK